MTRTYAIGDLHGRYDVLDACLKSIEKHQREHDDPTGKHSKIVFLGDYIDRGKDSKKVVERIMEGSRDNTKWITLLGNHELMCLMAHNDPEAHWKWWTTNGGLATSLSYPNKKVDEKHRAWMRSLPDRHLDRHRIYVHAGIKEGVPLSHQTQEMVLWIRIPRNQETPAWHNAGEEGRYIVHGHTPFSDGPVILESRCNLDTLSYSNGRAVIGVFDDAVAGKPVELLTVRAGFILSEEITG